MCKDLVEALEEIEDHSGMTILGGADTRSTTQAHQDGAAKAFERAAEVARAALANHRECDALEALRAIMDCHKNSIPVEIWAEGRRVVEAAT